MASCLLCTPLELATSLFGITINPRHQLCPIVVESVQFTSTTIYYTNNPFVCFCHAVVYLPLLVNNGFVGKQCIISFVQKFLCEF